MTQQVLIPSERRDAVFSDDRAYRYTLRIQWGDDSYAQFIGLNPSTADEVKDDPTVRRCKQWAKNWGYGGMVMTNIFAYRATDPKVMKAQPMPIAEPGPRPIMHHNWNDHLLCRIASRADVVVAAWGNHGAHLGRGAEVARLLVHRLQCFRVTKAGMPEHPLYIPYDTVLKPFPPFQNQP